MSRLLAVAIASIALVVTGCGDDDSASTTTTADGDGGITVEGAWARTSPMVSGSGAAYMKITSPEDDALVGASVGTEVAGKTELHETRMADGMDGMGGDTTGGMDGMDGMDGDMTTTTGASEEMTMVPVESIELPAGEAVELKPGGYHVMLLDLAAPLELGSSIEVTLDFENADDMTISVPVRDEAP